MSDAFIPAPADDADSVEFLEGWARHWDQYGTVSAALAFRRAAQEMTRLRAENAAKDARIAELESVMATRDLAQSAAVALYKEKVAAKDARIAELEAALHCENSPYEAKTHRCVHCDEEVLR